jgi:hypothetical protein
MYFGREPVEPASLRPYSEKSEVYSLPPPAVAGVVGAVR